MRIFELHFNPKSKEDLIFDSFCYEPENIYEKRLGSLFLVGELRNILPQNLKFLDNLTNFLKKQYYSAPVKFSPEDSLKESLKKANDFLEKFAKSGDVSWLGNLNLVVLNLTAQKNRWMINFTKVGNLKILLLREGEVIDIGKNLEFQDLEPYPLKIFGNIVSGKLAEGDRVLVLTKDVFSVFNQGSDISALSRQKSKKGKNFTRSLSVIEQIAQIALSNGAEERKLREILKTKEKEFLRISGICLLCILTKEDWLAEKKSKILTFQKEAEKFSILQVFHPIINRFKSLKLRLSKALTKLKTAAKKLLTPHHFLNHFIRIIQKTYPQKWWGADNLKKNIALVSFLIFFLLLGFFIFKREEETKLKKYQFTLTTIREDAARAESFLTLKNEKGAFDILKKARQEILPLTERKSAIQKEALLLKNSLEEKLEKVSKLEKISEPELFFEFDQKEFIPQKMAYSGGSLYFYNSFAENVYKLTQRAEKSVLQTDQKFNEAAPLNNYLLFFQKPNLVFLLSNDQFQNSLPLKLPYPDFTPKDLTTYQSNLYFLDGKNGEIIKYPGPISAGKDNPQIWLKRDAKKATDAKSVAVNGNVWVLNADNTISRYFGGDFQNSLTLDLFPFPKDFSKISSQFESLYLLEPVQKRLIVLAKTGKILKQFQSEKFDNLKDFAVSENGRTIWLLNGTKVYQINF